MGLRINLWRPFHYNQKFAISTLRKCLLKKREKWLLSRALDSLKCSVNFAQICRILVAVLKNSMIYLLRYKMDLKILSTISRRCLKWLNYWTNSMRSRLMNLSIKILKNSSSVSREIKIWRKRDGFCLKWLLTYRRNLKTWRKIIQSMWRRSSRVNSNYNVEFVIFKILTSLNLIRMIQNLLQSLPKLLMKFLNSFQL